MLRTSTNILSYCVDVVVSLDVTFSQNVRLALAVDGIVTCWYIEPLIEFPEDDDEFDTDGDGVDDRLPN